MGTGCLDENTYFKPSSSNAYSDRGVALRSTPAVLESPGSFVRGGEASKVKRE